MLQCAKAKKHKSEKDDYPILQDIIEAIYKDLNQSSKATTMYKEPHDHGPTA